jgi:uncharacterized membrane protein YdjX (TVP38/TMEM64 family)
VRELIRPMLPMILVVAIPIVPFLLWGERVDAWLAAWRANPPAWPIIAAIVVGLLATDVFLPIPSSLISTLAGSELGIFLGIATTWVGMSLGAVLGFGLARWAGPAVVRRLVGPRDLSRTAQLVEQFGPWLLVIGRGVPVVAESTVLLFGMHQLAWRKFLPPVLLANLGLAATYSLFGDLADRYHSLPLAMGIAIALPVLLVAALRSTMPRPNASPSSNSESS